MLTLRSLICEKKYVYLRIKYKGVYHLFSHSMNKETESTAMKLFPQHMSCGVKTIAFLHMSTSFRLRKNDVYYLVD